MTDRIEPVRRGPVPAPVPPVPRVQRRDRRDDERERDEPCHHAPAPRPADANDDGPHVDVIA